MDNLLSNFYLQRTCLISSCSPNQVCRHQMNKHWGELETNSYETENPVFLVSKIPSIQCSRHLDQCHHSGLTSGIGVMWASGQSYLLLPHERQKGCPEVKAVGSSEKYYWKGKLKESKYPIVSRDRKKHLIF